MRATRIVGQGFTQISPDKKHREQDTDAKDKGISIWMGGVMVRPVGVEPTTH